MKSALAGRGGELRYVNGAADWWAHYALCTVTRLRLLTWLCTHAGEHGATEILRALDLRPCARRELAALRFAGLVHARWYPGARRVHSPSGRREYFRFLWSPTWLGRCYLWRYGWVTGRLVPWSWTDDTFHGRVDICPCEVLRTDTDASFLRPTAMAMAYALWMFAPMFAGDMGRLLGCSRELANWQLKKWESKGWAIREPPRDSPVGPPRFGQYPRAQWRFNREGLRALERHVHALRWAAQNSGYEVPPDDRFYLGNDQVHWYTPVFTSSR